MIQREDCGVCNGTGEIGYTDIEAGEMIDKVIPCSICSPRPKPPEQDDDRE